MKPNNYSNLFLISWLTLQTLYCFPSKAEQPKKASDGKNILVYLAAGTYSMRLSMWPLLEGLTEKGHHVTFLSGLESKAPDPRITEFVPPKIKELRTASMDDFDFIAERKSGENRKLWYTMGPEFCEQLYANPAVMEWIKKSTFDLVIVDTENDCGFGLACYFKAKTIVFSTLASLPYFYDSYGIGDDSSWAADMTQYFPPFNATFFGRIIAALNPVVFKVIREYYYFPQYDKIIKKALSQLGVKNVPTISELEKNASLVFITSHYAQEYARSFPPNVIPIGGLAVTGKVKPLPKDLEDFINKGKNGFIFISFGSNFEFAKLEQKQKDLMLKALLQFPDIQFIWKAAKGVGVDLPDNFMISSWVPQQDLLAHSKIRAFVTHGGLGSINEAIYHGIPMLALPIYGDQDFNTNFLEPRGIGISLEITTLTTDQLKDALEQITTDQKFARKAKQISKLFKDRPMTPLDTAVWWTEFVLRHDTEEILEFMQSRSIHQSWWVRRQLDVWLFLFTLVALVVIISWYTLHKLLGIIFGGRNHQQKRKMKQT